MDANPPPRPGLFPSTWMVSPSSIHPDGGPLKPYCQNMSPCSLGSFGRPRWGCVNLEKDVCSRQVTHPQLDTAESARPRAARAAESQCARPGVECLPCAGHLLGTQQRRRDPRIACHGEPTLSWGQCRPTPDMPGSFTIIFCVIFWLSAHVLDLTTDPCF